jgi:hypothetical protein
MSPKCCADRPALYPEGAFSIELADGGVGALLEALEACPLSEELSQRLWDELLDPERTKSGPDGVIDCADLSALGVGAENLVAAVKLGRAGEALVTAFRALSGPPLEEIGPICHCGSFDVTEGR